MRFSSAAVSLSLLLCGCPDDAPVAGLADAELDAGGGAPTDAAAEAPDARGGVDANEVAGDAGLEAADAAAVADASAPDAAGGLDAAGADAGPMPLRYLAINAGNASVQFNCWEYKLCRKQDVENVRAYIAAWQPDVVMISEVYQREQLTGTAVHGPILPPGYEGLCGESRHRDTGALAAFDAKDSSHEHECVAWKSTRASLVPGSARSAYGRNDATGRSDCSYDFTGFRVQLELAGGRRLSAVTVHPDSQQAACRTEEIGRYWSELASGDAVIGGDWNSDQDSEIAPPARFRINYERGRHWSLADHPDEYSAEYGLGLVRRKLDDAYSSFGDPCTTCGPAFGTASLEFGSVLGGYHGHPRADSGDGLDHRQILVDLLW